MEGIVSVERPLCTEFFFFFMKYARNSDTLIVRWMERFQIISKLCDNFICIVVLFSYTDLTPCLVILHIIEHARVDYLISPLGDTGHASARWLSVFRSVYLRNLIEFNIYSYEERKLNNGVI